MLHNNFRHQPCLYRLHADTEFEGGDSDNFLGGIYGWMSRFVQGKKSHHLREMIIYALRHLRDVA
jgi:hypothetical protein